MRAVSGVIDLDPNLASAPPWRCSSVCGDHVGGRCEVDMGAAPNAAGGASEPSLSPCGMLTAATVVEVSTTADRLVTTPPVPGRSGKRVR